MMTTIELVRAYPLTLLGLFSSAGAFAIWDSGFAMRRRRPSVAGVKRLVPARAFATSTNHIGDQNGEASGAGMAIERIYSSCPVQAERCVDGQAFYFRARYDTWTFYVGINYIKGRISVDDAWSYSEKYGINPYDAGYISYDEARLLIEKAVVVFRSRHQPPP